jgi:hypothetical protein
MEQTMTDDDVVQALRRHRPVGPPGHLRSQVTGPTARCPPASDLEASRQTARWWIWLPAATGLAIALALGLSASSTHRAIVASDQQLQALFQKHEEQLVDPDDATADGRQTEAKRLLWLADVREAELVIRQRGITAGAR